MKKLTLLLALLGLFNSSFAAENWDLIDKPMVSWNEDGNGSTNKKWSLSRGNNAPAEATIMTKKESFVNMTKTEANFEFKYAFLCSPAQTSLQSKTAYTFEIKARVNPIDKKIHADGTDKNTGYEMNQLGARLMNKTCIIYLKYDSEGAGYLALTDAASHSAAQKHLLDISQWHTYRFVLYADNSKFDVYVDDEEEPVYEAIATGSVSGSNILKLGAESWHRCNMDIESVKMGTGNFNFTPKIASVSIGSDSHVEGQERSVKLTINTFSIPDGKKLQVALFDEQGDEAVAAVETTVASDKAELHFLIPATVAKGNYQLAVSAPDNKIEDVEVKAHSLQYVIVDPSPLTGKLFPEMEAIGFIADMDDYKYQPISKEFIFPSLVDTKPNAASDGRFLNNEAPIDRYYLFYTPHNDPGGMYLATGPSLDGPWTEQGVVIDLAWAKAITGNIISTAPHISACQVVWNDIANKYYIYFHGPNSTSHYATSDNLKDWTFGGTVFKDKDFSSLAEEASYARVFEYKVSGLNNKYIVLLMIAERINGTLVRKIYWGHSQDGINWTCVTKPLISPNLAYKKVPGTDTKPSYHLDGIGSNVSGPYFMERDGRCFVFFHGSAGNICVAEVGQAFDMEVHWGEYIYAKDVKIVEDTQGGATAVSRVASPLFIQSDTGTWYLFLEAGGRLGANIAYAREKDKPSEAPITAFDSVVASSGFVSLSARTLNPNDSILISTLTDETSLAQVALYAVSGKELACSSVAAKAFEQQVPSAAGLYILSVHLSNGLSEEFKIVVK